MSLRYWKGFVIPSALLHSCENEIEQLKAGLYKSLDFEKLHIQGETLYSIRVNRADRLIMTEHLGVLIVLDYIHNHDYENCKFLKSRGIAHYLEHKMGLTQSLLDDQFQKVSIEEIDALEQKIRRDDTKSSFAEFHDGKWVELTDIQQNTTHEKLPLIVFGPGGSGKSTIALSMLLDQSFTSSLHDFPCLYLSESPILVEEMQRQFHAMSPDDKTNVYFSTIKDLVIERFGIPNERLVSKEHFLAFLKKPHLKNNKKWNKILEKNPDMLWEEIGILAACENEEAYQRLAPLDSLVSKDERSMILNLFEAYTNLLKAEHLCAYELLKIDEVLPAYSLILIDEAQNMPPALAKVISRLAVNHQIVYFSGEQQAIKGRVNNYSRIKAYYHSLTIPLSESHLNTTHRCSFDVTELTNAFMRLKRQVIGGVTKKGELTHLEAAHEGHTSQILWITPENIPSMGKSLNVDSADFAVVTLDEHLEDIKRILPKAVIFTVAQAQGLGIKNLMVYKVLQPELYEVLIAATHKKDSKNRAIRDQVDLKHSQALDLFITAIMRAEGNLTIVQSADHRYAKDIKSLFSPFINQTTIEEKTAYPISSSLEWEVKANYYLKLGHVEQARHIWCTILERSPDSFPGHHEKAEKMPIELGYSTEDQVFVEQWLKKSKTIKNPSKLFNQLMEYPRLSNILMNLPTDGQECLMAYIVQEASLKKSFQNMNEHRIFQKILRSKRTHDELLWIDYIFQECPEILSKLTENNHFCSEFYALNLLCEARLKLWLSQHEHGLPILRNILHYSKKNLEHFFSETIFNSMVNEHSFQSKSIFELLTQSPAGIQFILKSCEKKSILNFLSQRVMTDFLQFCKLIKNHQALKILQLFLKENPKCIDLLSKESFYTRETQNLNSCFFLLCKMEMTPLLKLMFSIRPDLIIDLPEHALYDTQAENMIMPGMPAFNSAFFWLTASPTGIELIQLIFEKNPNLILHMSMGALYGKLSTILEINSPISPFYMLCRTTSGYEILQLIFEKNPGLVEEIPIDSLCTILPEMYGPFSGTSSLYCLSITEQGRELLYFIFEKNPKLNQQITFESLCKLTTADPLNKNFKNSAFFLHAAVPKGCLFLNNIFNHNPAMIENLKAEILYRPLSKISADSATLSILLNLARHNDGCELLKMIFEKNQSLLHPLLLIALFEPIRIKSIICNYFSIFYIMTKTNFGCHLLHYIFQKKQSFIADVHKDMLYHSIESIQGLKTSAFYWLTQNTAGCELLNLIYENNPALINALTIDMLHLSHQNSQLYHLSRTLEGSKILKTIFENHPTLCTQLPFEALNISPPRSSGIHVLASTLFYLSATPTGCELLLFILEKNRPFIQQFTIDTLCQPFPKDSVALENISVLFCLTVWKKGCEVLKLIFENQPSLILQLPPDALFRIITEKNIHFAMTAAFTHLCATAEGCEVLAQLLEGNKTLIQKLPIDLLCQKTPDTDQEKALMSALFFMSSYGKACQILNMILSENPKLICPQLIESLCFVIPKDTSMLFKTSGFYGLTTSHEGIKVLELIFTRHPELSMQLTAESMSLIPHQLQKDGPYKSALHLLSEFVLGHPLLKIFITHKPTFIAEIHQFLEQSQEWFIDENFLNLLNTSEEGLFVKEKLSATTKHSFGLFSNIQKEVSSPPSPLGP